MTPADGEAGDEVVRRLVAAGCVAAEEEAAELTEAAHGDSELLAALVERRVGGEPLAWVVGGVRLCGEWVRVNTGVYVPRLQSAELAQRALALLPANGVAVDLCTGSGALAVVLARGRPGARVVGSDIDAAACRCAAANGVEVYEGDLDEPLPAEVRGAVDVVVGVVPYVPSEEIEFLPRDARDHEPLSALDGGPGGLTMLRRAAEAATRLLRPDGTLLLELGGDQAAALTPDLLEAGYDTPTVLYDEDGDPRAVEARWMPGETSA